MTVFEILSLAVPTVTAVVLGVLNVLAMMRLQRQAEEKRREDRRRDEERAILVAQLRDIHGDVRHVDECLDDFKVQVLSNAVTKGDLVAHEADVRATISDVSNRIGLDTNGLHQRIFRVESHMFKIAAAD